MESLKRIDSKYFNGVVYKHCDIRYGRGTMVLNAGKFKVKDEYRPQVVVSGQWVKYDPSLLKSIVVHEMIRAFLYLTENADPERHGPNFMTLMTRINREEDLDMRITLGYTYEEIAKMFDVVLHAYDCCECDRTWVFDKETWADSVMFLNHECGPGKLKYRTI